MQIKKISQYRNQLGEGPWWNKKTNYLHWTDIIEGNLHSYDPKKKDETIKKLLFVIKYTFIDFIEIFSPIFKIFIIFSTWKTWRKQNFICISFGFN